MIATQLLAGISPRLVLGTLSLSTAEPDTAFRVLDAWVELGGRLIDTAAVYNDGESERVVGHWLRSRGNRESVAIITKGGHPDDTWQGRLDAASLAADLSASLERLDIESVDLYLLHRDDPAVAAGAVMQTLHEQVQAGRVRTIGASNWTTDRVDAANAHAAAHGLVRFSALSNYFGLAVPTGPPYPQTVSSTGTADRAWLQRTGIPLLAWSSLSSGWFGLKDSDSGHLPDPLPAFDTEQNRQRRQRATSLAGWLGCSAPQVALAYVLAQPFAPYAVIGARSAEHLEAAWHAATAVVLDTRDLTWLEWGDGSPGSAAPTD